MNASYNRTYEEISANAEQGARAGSFSLIALIAAILTAIISIVRSKVFRAIAVTGCFFIALGVVGGVETGTLTFGAALLILIPVALIEWLCLRKN